VLKNFPCYIKKDQFFFIAGSSPDTPWKKCTANFKEKVITITKNKKEEIEINITQLSQPLKISDIGEAPNGSTTMYFINVFYDKNVDKFASESREDLIDWIERINKTIEITGNTPKSKRKKE